MSDAADPDEWEPVAKQSGGWADPPRLTVYASLDGRINAAADRALDHPEAVEIRLAGDGHRFALVPADEPGPSAWSLTRADDSDGGDVRLRSPLQALGVDSGEVEITQSIPLTVEDGVAIADWREREALDPQEGGYDGEDDEYPHDWPTPEATVAEHDLDDKHRDVLVALDAHGGEVEQRTVTESVEWSDSTVSLAVTDLTHAGVVRKIDTGRGNVLLREGAEPTAATAAYLDGDDGGEDGTDASADDDTTTDSAATTDARADADAAVPDPDDSPSLGTVRDCAAQVDTVQELAGLLDVSTDEARFEARRADVYGDLRDAVDRPGVSD